MRGNSETLAIVERAKLTPPTVTLGGTSRDELVGGYLEAARRIRETLAALGRTEPNGRDYLSVASLLDAQREHRSRVERLSGVLSELVRLAAAIADA